MEKSFETSLAELEQIVTKLEDGDLPLEESLELFEKGIKLSRECRERLTKAERRIEILMKDVDGDMAPDFTLTDTAGAKVKLSDFRGKNNVVLAFYIFAFTGG